VDLLSSAILAAELLELAGGLAKSVVAAFDATPVEDIPPQALAAIQRIATAQARLPTLHALQQAEVKAAAAARNA